MGVAVEDILSFDLVLYNAEAPQLIGFEGELLSAPRLDNLTSAFACLAGITGPQRKAGVNIAAFFDNEEVGSRTKTGADSDALTFITEKIAYALGLDRAGYLNALLSGFLLSCDVAHALHPNRMELYDGENCALMNRGVSLKLNYSQRYATDAVGVGIVEGLCKARNIPYQRFMNKAGSPGGGTLGKFTASSLSMPSRHSFVSFP
jgi:aspartyl aminopeptidase